MARRRYTKTEKASVVATATMEGTRAAADHTGVPESTIRYWLDKPEFAQLREKTRDSVADEFWATIQVGVHRLAELIPRTEDLQKVATAVGILYDKHALLTGGATGRTESRDLTGTLSDGDLISAVHEAITIAGSRGTPEADPVEAEG